MRGRGLNSGVSMAHRIKSLSAYPLDIPTLTGPAILPAHGEIVADLGAVDADMLAHSPFVALTEEAKPKGKGKA